VSIYVFTNTYGNPVDQLGLLISFQFCPAEEEKIKIPPIFFLHK
jgi:hypothetical protein